MSMSQQVNSEVQAVVTLTDSQTEHVAADIDASLVATQSSAINESFDDYAGNTTLPHGTSLQHLGDQQDSSSQTDPVTIIIGDASFLVKKVLNFINCNYNIMILTAVKFSRFHLKLFCPDAFVFNDTVALHVAF